MFTFKRAWKFFIIVIGAFCFIMLPTVSALAAAMTVDLSKGNIRRVKITTGRGWWWTKTLVYVVNNGQGLVFLYPEFGSTGGYYYSGELRKGQQKPFELKGGNKTYYLKLQPSGRRKGNKVYITVGGQGSSIQTIN